MVSQEYKITQKKHLKLYKNEYLKQSKHPVSSGF